MTTAQIKGAPVLTFGNHGYLATNSASSAPPRAPHRPGATPQRNKVFRTETLRLRGLTLKAIRQALEAEGVRFSERGVELPEKE